MLFQTSRQDGLITRENVQSVIGTVVVVMVAAALWVPLLVGVGGAYVAHRNGWLKTGEIR